MRNHMLLPLAALLMPISALAQEAGSYTPPAPAANPVPQAAGMNPVPSAAPKANMLPVARNGEVIDSVGSGAIPAVLPIEKTQNGVRYISGGVGDEELAELKAREQEYNVRVLISAAKGEYMSGVTLRFTDAKGAEVATLENVGPYVYAALPAGSYNVQATSAMGVTKNVKITAPEKAAAGAKTHITF